MGLSLTLFFVVPGLIFAQPQGGGPIEPACPAGELCNPLAVDSIEDFVLAVIDVIIVFLIPVIILYIMYAGFLFVKAQGNPGEISEAKKALLTALIGGVIVLGAEAILQVVRGTIDEIRRDPAAQIDIPYV
jgi:hypothetical protein